MRAAGTSDLAAVAAIQAACPEAAQWETGFYLGHDLRVAECENGVAGFLAARTLAPGESEILNLAVAPAVRRQGVARALIESWLRDFPGEVFLEVRASNQAAQKFYNTMGFKELTVRPQYYSSPSESAIVMKFHSC